MTPLSLSLMIVGLQAVAPTAPASDVTPLHGAAAEEFLRTAKVSEIKGFDTRGVTRPRRATLSDGAQSVRALFKTIDEYRPKQTLEGGEVIMRFRDRYQHEIAAYELDKLLGLGIVPPCVQRRIRTETGALCLWIEDTMTEWERRMELKIEPPDPVAWENQMDTIELYLQLIYDIDYKNISNLLIDDDFRIYKIDASRAFRNTKTLRKEALLDRFSRTLLDALERLDRKQVDAALRRWLTKAQIDALMARRDRILELAAERIAEQGEAAVLFP